MDGRHVDAFETKDPIHQRKIQFLALYYQLNKCCDALAAARKRGINVARSLRLLEKWLRIREDLESQMAPRGVIAEPLLKNGRTINLFFTAPTPEKPGRYSMCLKVPLPRNPAKRGRSALR